MRRQPHDGPWPGIIALSLLLAGLAFAWWGASWWHTVPGPVLAVFAVLAVAAGLFLLMVGQLPDDWRQMNRGQRVLTALGSVLGFSLLLWRVVDHQDAEANGPPLTAAWWLLIGASWLIPLLGP